jgi:RNA polymerase sigma-70 factor (ECF subfamily)
MNPDEVASFHRGEDALFTRLVALHSPQLLGVAIRLVGDRARAHDLVHDAWVQAYHRRRTFSATGSFVGWMLSILRSCLSNEVRAASRQSAKVDAYIRDTAVVHDPSEQMTAALDAEATQLQLLDALARLTERQRDVVVMRIVEGRSTSDTAQALGIAEGTVKATLFQALHRMRTSLPEIAP